MIGQLMVQLARLAGAVTIILATRHAGRRALAESLGATATVDPRAADVVAAGAGPGGLAPGGVDVALECAGAGAAPQGAQARISPFDIFARELRIVGSYLNPLTHGRAVELFASGHLALAPLVTRRLTLDEVPPALAAPPEPGDVKAIVLA